MPEFHPELNSGVEKSGVKPKKNPTNT